MHGLRKILADSQIAAVAIAALLMYSIGELVEALLQPVERAVNFIVTAIAILDIPFVPHTLTIIDRMMIQYSAVSLAFSFLFFAEAWVIAKWVYGAGPMKGLALSYARLSRRLDV